MPALPNFGWMETFGAGAEKRKSSEKKNGGRRDSSVFVVGSFDKNQFFFVCVVGSVPRVFNFVYTSWASLQTEPTNGWTILKSYLVNHCELGLENRTL